MKFSSIFTFAAVASGILLSLGSQQVKAAPQAEIGVSSLERAQSVKKIFQVSCLKCHGMPGERARGDFDFILDRDKMVQQKFIIPFDAEASYLYERIKLNEMPPQRGTSRPLSDQDIKVIYDWIQEGAPDFKATFVAEPIVFSKNYARQNAKRYLESLSNEEPSQLRFFSLDHLLSYRSADEIKTIRQGLFKLINSLSLNPTTVTPKAIDSKALVFAIRLSDYSWKASTWRKLNLANPYLLRRVADFLAPSSGDDTVDPNIIRADWFVATASKAPVYSNILYDDLLNVRTASRSFLNLLERRLNLSRRENIASMQAMRSGFNNSGVSQNNRIIERHIFPPESLSSGAYWISYDFDGNSPELNLRQNIFRFPLGPFGDGPTFKHAGGEIIFNLPNQLQAYALVSESGEALAKAPQTIVSDPLRPDRAVENAVSCMSCHATGILPKRDQVRDSILQNTARLTENERRAVLKLYPESKVFEEAQKQDSERFQTALANLGLTHEGIEPISTATLLYEKDLDLKAVAGELQVEPEQILRALDSSRILNDNLGVLRSQRGTVKRDVFLEEYRNLYSALKRTNGRE